MSEPYWCHDCKEHTEGDLCPYCGHDFGNSRLRRLGAKIAEKTREIINEANNNDLPKSINDHRSG